MIHATRPFFWTHVLRGRQCTCVAEMRTSLCCSCELAVTVKVTPKKCTWMSAVAVTSRRISKCLAQQSRSRHLNVHGMTRNHCQWLGRDRDFQPINLVESHIRHPVLDYIVYKLQKTLIIWRVQKDHFHFICREQRQTDKLFALYALSQITACACVTP